MAICHQLRRIKGGSITRQSAAHIYSLYINASSYFNEITAYRMSNLRACNKFT